MTDNHIHNGDIGISMSRVTAAEGSPPATLSNSEQKRQGPSVVLVRASEIVPESVRWIWPGIIAKGKVTGLAGHPGLGKSQVALDVAATVSTGRRWPGGSTTRTPVT